MDNLNKYLQFKEDQVNGLVKSAGEPSESQLMNFMSAFANQFLNEIVTIHAPPSVKRIAKSGLNVMGWDYRRSTGSKLSSSRFIKGVDYMQAELAMLNSPIDPSTEELRSLPAAVKKMWDLDVNRLRPNIDYVINVQGGKTLRNQMDVAPDPFFTFVDAQALSKPTFKAFIELLDNYFAVTGTTEVVTAHEKKENYTFLKHVMDTPVMKYCHNLLQKLGYAPADNREFIRLLDDLWFGLYTRERHNDSSGFEHVFVGEIDEGAVSGMHNWIQLYLEEKKGNLDYQGYIKSKRTPSIQGCRVDKNAQQLVTIQFEWHDYLKKMSSSLIGTSPEFEISLYTLCFLAGEEKSIVTCGPYRMELTCYTYTSRGKKHIASSYPSDIPLDEHEAATKIQSSYRGRSSRRNKRN